MAAPASWWGRNPIRMPEEETPADWPAWARGALACLRAEWEYIGLTRPQDFGTLLRFALATIPRSATICLIAFFTRPYLDKTGALHPTPTDWEALNIVMRKVAADFPNATVVESNDLLD